jgi:hypothetical protein
MFNFLRRKYVYYITSGGQLFLLGLASQLKSLRGWQICLALIALISVYAWVSAYRRLRMIDDTPTSKIASAAQGYVELHGVATALDGHILHSPLNQHPCLWYRFHIEKGSRGLWEDGSHGESNASFILDDGSGQCLINPEGAEFLVSHEDTWEDNNYRYTQHLLRAQDTIFAIGEFSTHSSVNRPLDSNEQVKLLLDEWKKTPEALLARFDLNGDGELNQEEWALARQQAKREVARQAREVHKHNEMNMLQRPKDGRPYLISDLTPDKIATKYRLWSWLHLAIFFSALAIFPFLPEIW